MIKCIECNYKFTIIDRIKLLFNGKLKCKKCGIVYKAQSTVYRVLYMISICILSIFISPILTNYKGINISFLSRLLILCFVSVLFIIAYDLIPHKLQKYTNEQEKN